MLFLFILAEYYDWYEQYGTRDGCKKGNDQHENMVLFLSHRHRKV